MGSSLEEVMNLRHIKYVVLLTALSLILHNTISHAQEEETYGKILSIDDQSVTAVFEDVRVSVGEEIEFVRLREIIDPVTSKVRGRIPRTVATGVVRDLGMEKVRISLIEFDPSNPLRISDKVHATGRGKKIIRQKKIAVIQELTDESTMVIDLGTEDEISEGDEFLIQRVENVYDPQTNEVTETREVEVGRGRVSSVEAETSVGSVVTLNPGMELLQSDMVVFDPALLQPLTTTIADAGELDELRNEVTDLREEVSRLKATLDSLGIEHDIHRNEFIMFRREMEQVASQLLRGDIAGTSIVIKNDEPIRQSGNESMFAEYRRALDTCLSGKHEESIPLFKNIISQYPGSKLTENCRYWIAQSYYGMKNYETALEGFRTVLGDARLTHKDDDASIMAGITLYRLGRPQDALQEFRSFLKRYPDSEYAGKVRYWINRLS